MIKKIDNKGLTAVEVLLCFSIVMIIVTSMLKVVTNQREKQSIESTKSAITTFKNTTMKAIYDDIKLANGIASVDNIQDSGGIYTISFTTNEPTTYPNYNKRFLYIYTNIECDSENASKKCEETNYISYETGNISKCTNTCYSYTIGTFHIPDIYNLKFNEPRIEIINNNLGEPSFFKIYIGFYHPDLANKYSALDFVLPINQTTE